MGEVRESFGTTMLTPVEFVAELAAHERGLHRNARRVRVGNVPLARACATAPPASRTWRSFR